MVDFHQFLIWQINAHFHMTSLKVIHICFGFTFRAVFTWVSKVNCVCFGFALLRLVIGSKILRHFLSQSEQKPKPIMTRSRTFSHASCRPHVFASSFDWFTGLSVFFVIGQSNYFGFGFTTLNWKLLY